MAKINENFRWDAYRFLIQPWRDTDQSGVLERFVGAIQEAWESTQGSIDDIADLSDVDTIPDEFLVYLQWHVGWTTEMDRITNGLTADELRKLIKVSATMWKQKGTQRGIKSAIRLLTGSDAIIWNWFAMRWIVGATDLWFTLNRGDSWIVGESDEYLSVVFVKDSAALNRQLIRDIIDLNRPVNESYLLIFPDFVDEFENGLGQWNQEGSVDAEWDEDTFSVDLVPDADIVAVVDAYDTWEQAYIMFQVEADDSAAFLTLEFMRKNDGDDCYIVQFSMSTCELYTNDAGVLSGILASGVPSGWVAGTKIALWCRVTWQTDVSQLVEVGVGTQTVLSYQTDAGSYIIGGKFALVNDSAATFNIDRTIAYDYPVHQDVVSGPGNISLAPAALVASPARVFNYQFIGSATGWTLTGLWHYSTHRYFTGPGSLYWGTGESGYTGTGVMGGYVSGSALNQTALSAMIDLSAFNDDDHAADLEIWQYRNVRSGGNDLTTVDVMVNGVVQQTTTIPGAGASIQRFAFVPGILGSALVQLRFRMNMVSSKPTGTEEGWFLDNVSILISRV